MSIALESGNVETKARVIKAGARPPRAVALSSLTVQDQVRTGGLRGDHVELLAQLEGNWPPIIVWGPRICVIDGFHRVAAARRLGHTRIMAVHFAGSAEDAFLISVQSNIAHGLPLALEDRKKAAQRILCTHRQWSDRRIAEVCALSAKVVARIRSVTAASSNGKVTDDGSAAPINRRVGKDGKVRPLRPEDIHEQIRLALEADPSASLRSIAAVARTSPETVRRFRSRDGAGMEFPHVDPSRGVPATPTWEIDPAIASSIDGEKFSDWFSSNAIDDQWSGFVHSLPLSRIYEVADEARRRATIWTEFARNLESRVNRVQPLHT